MRFLLKLGEGNVLETCVSIQFEIPLGYHHERSDVLAAVSVTLCSFIIVTNASWVRAAPILSHVGGTRDENNGF
jgi:hypothetical protein